MSNNTEATTNDIMEFLKENMPMKEDFVSLEKRVEGIETRMATKEDLKELATKKDIERLEARLFEFQMELEAIKTKLNDIEKRLKDDTDAVVQDVLKLKARVAILEKQLGIQSNASLSTV